MNAFDKRRAEADNSSAAKVSGTVESPSSRLDTTLYRYWLPAGLDAIISRIAAIGLGDTAVLSEFFSSM